MSEGNGPSERSAPAIRTKSISDYGLDFTASKSDSPTSGPSLLRAKSDSNPAETSGGSAGGSGPVKIARSTSSDDPLQPTRRGLSYFGTAVRKLNALPMGIQMLRARQETEQLTSEKRTKSGESTRSFGSTFLSFPSEFVRLARAYSADGTALSGEDDDDEGIINPGTSTPSVDFKISFDTGFAYGCKMQNDALPNEVLDRYLLSKWRCINPRLVISIMGGAGLMQINKNDFNESSFQQGLVDAAIKTGAWIITGGTASGVMKMVGEALKQHDRQQQVPCIGVTAFGALTTPWREQLGKCECDAEIEAVSEDKPPDEKLLALPQENHTHLIFIDNGVTGMSAFGSEVDFRVQLESCIAFKQRGASGFLEGDVVRIVKEGSRVKGKDGIVIDPYFHGGVQVRMKDPDPRSTIKSYKPEELEKVEAPAKEKVKLEWQDLVKSVIDSVAYEVPRVMILVNGGGISLSSIKTAIESGCPVVICRGSGRCADAICDLLINSENKETIGEEEIKQAWEHMGAEVLNESKAEILKFIFQQQSSVKMYSSSQRLEDRILSAVLDNPRAHKEATYGDRLNATWHQLVLAVQWCSTTHYERLGQKLVKMCNAVLREETHYTKADAEAHGPAMAISLIFLGLVCSSSRIHHKTTESVSLAPLISWLVQNHRKHIDKIEINADSALPNIAWNKMPGDEKANWKVGVEGLLVWCTEQEAPDNVLDTLWLHVEDPVHAALVVASACRETALAKHSAGSYNDDIATDRLEALATRYERLARHALEELTTCTGVSPEEYLFQPASDVNGQPRWAGKDCFHLAVWLDCKKFVKTRFYRMAVDSYYRRPSPFCISEADKQLNVELPHLLLGFLRLRDSKLTSREFFSVPYVKAMTNLLSRMIFLIVYTTSVFSGTFTTPSLAWAKIILFVYGISYALIEWKQYIAAGNFELYIDFWNAIDCLHITLLLGSIVAGGIIADRSEESSSTGEYALEVIHALNLLPSFVKIFHVFLLSEYFGTLVLVIGKMVSDVGSFSLLLFIFCLMFSSALTPILFRTKEDRWNNGILWTFWTVFGDIDSGVKDKINELQFGPIREFMRLLHYMLHLFTNVLLVNLLIAVMGSTYEQAKEQSETEWSFQKAKTALEYIEEEGFPPPFNLLELVLPDMKSGHVEQKQKKHLARQQSKLGKQAFARNTELRMCREKALERVSREEEAASSDKIPATEDQEKMDYERKLRRAELELEFKDEQLQIQREMNSLRHQLKEKDDKIAEFEKKIAQLEGRET